MGLTMPVGALNSTQVARYGDDMALPEIGQRRVLWSRKTVRVIICVGKWGVIRCS